MNEKSLENLKKADDFSSTNQPSPEAKSRGKIEASIKRNLLETLRSRIDEWDLVDKVVSGVNSEVDNGNLKNAIELLKIAKEPEKQEINLNGGVEVQKVFIDEATKKETQKHIKEFIND
ncbi:MAG: hypothetical protein E7373_06640 [Clostridiales bacterium]|jgi:hypothetical protein|nr:hypothetical protein [Clostridiales bacterium]